MKRKALLFSVLPMLALTLVLTATMSANAASTPSVRAHFLGTVGHTTPTKSHPDNLSYGGGPVMVNTQNAYAIFWRPTGTYMAPGYKSLIKRYFGDIGSSGLYHNNIQYPQSNGQKPTNVALAGVWTDTHAYPSGTLSDAQIQNEARHAQQVNGWTSSLTNMFFVFTAKGENICVSFGCAFSSWCAYHYNSGNLIYATMPYVGTSLNTCWTGMPGPNNNIDADAEINVISHEQIESATDPQPFSGWNSGNGEIGDLCAWNFGNVNLDNGKANVQWNGHYYIVQQEWDNHISGCTLSGP